MYFSGTPTLDPRGQLRLPVRSNSISSIVVDGFGTTPLGKGQYVRSDTRIRSG